MISIDMRFDEKVIGNLIGKRFIKYKCDPFVYTNSVTANVGLYIDKEIFNLNNIQTSVDYFGTSDDCGVFTLEQVENSVAEIIEKITIINENQRIYKNGVQTYDVWLTRGIIFHFAEHEISFEKDNIPFSQEIII